MKRCLIIGAGGIGKRHIRGYLKTGRAGLSVVETNPDTLKDVLDTYDFDKGYASLDDAPLDEFDFAVMASPAHTHVPIGMELVKAGLPFFTEKPLAVTMDGVDELIEAVNDAGLTVRVGYVRRATAWINKLRDDIAAGRLGEVRMAWAQGCQDYRKYRPDYARIYYARPDSGGGAILDAATHSIDLLLWIMGPVAEVSAMYDRLVFDDTQTEDTAFISLRFESGAMAQILMNQFQKPNEAQLNFAGTKANFKVKDSKGLLLYADDDSGEWQREEFIEQGLAPMEVHEAKFSVQANAYMDALDGKPDRLTTLEEARMNLAVCLAAKQSYKEGRLIRL